MMIFVYVEVVISPAATSHMTMYETVSSSPSLGIVPKMMGFKSEFSNFKKRADNFM